MCGFTAPRQAQAAVEVGADLIGLNFYPESPRAISFGQAETIQTAVHRASALRDSKRPARTVAVLVDPDIELVLNLLKHVKPDILQFHGDEEPRFCQYFKHPFIKAFRLRKPSEADDVPRFSGGYNVGFLVDSFSIDEFGGTGKVLSTTLAERALKHPRGFLAGGLTPANVADAVHRLRPYGVDVASGIETRPGRKSSQLMADFVRAVRQGTERAAADNRA